MDRHGVVTRDGVRVGIVYRKETTKTGFRRGYCVGQVPVTRWFWKLDGGFEQDGLTRETRFGAFSVPGWPTRGTAFAAMIEATK
jgi:hypothetical protein